ncbi:S8 family peptidase [Flammeovirga pacifica]|uniref:Peptidase S8/S53 domain-containing protein n=1 Tax=Flammeovirga pacifica TaxID=915059 RepID=A0A1S1Z534_FLAPC|nr:S8 family peptidase [Flammeovirga pacifica]OHX68327.1 hypothetical protein NH26_19230 [Flammeovirga pacifica]
MRPLFILLFFVFISESQAQDSFFLVTFHNKDNTTHSLERPEEFLSVEAIARRDKFNIDIDSTDLPIALSNIEAVETAGAKIWYATKWLNGVIVSEADSSAIAQLDIVEKVRNMSDKTLGGIEKSYDYKESFKVNNARNQVQNEMIGLDVMHEMGYKGQGIKIAVLDAGFSNYNNVPQFSDVDIVDTYDFYSKNSTVEDDHHHGTEVMSTMAAFEEGEYEGGSPEASYYLYRTENTSFETRIEELMWLMAAERADSIGIDIIQSSLGYYDFDEPSQNYTHEDLNGKIAWITLAANHAFQKGIVVVVSAGNEGNSSWEKITFPSDSPFVLTIGSVNANEEKALSSSIGPTADNRIKPDVMALGQSCVVIGTNGTVKSSSGTSFSAPQMASFVAGLLEHNGSLTPSQVMNMVKQSGDRKFNLGNEYGYGIPNFSRALNVSAISDITTLDEVKVYPNPVNGERISLELPQEMLGKTIKIEWFNMEGRKLDKIKLSQLDKINTIDVPAKARGQYILLRIQFDGGVRTIKVKVN